VPAAFVPVPCSAFAFTHAPPIMRMPLPSTLPCHEARLKIAVIPRIFCPLNMTFLCSCVRCLRRRRGRHSESLRRAEVPRRCYEQRLFAWYVLPNQVMVCGGQVAGRGARRQ